MKFQSDGRGKRGLAAALWALMLMPGLAGASSVGPGARVEIEQAYERMKLAPELRQRFDELLRGREALLDFLPVAQLERILVGPTSIELFFDFGKKDEKCLEIPAVRLWALDRKGKLISVETDAHRIVIQDRVRIDFEATGALRIRRGDLQGKKLGLRWDLEVCTLRCPNRLVRDAEGHVLLRTDSEGRPVLENGRFVARTSDEWLVVEAGGDKFEIALSGS